MKYKFEKEDFIRTNTFMLRKTRDQVREIADKENTSFKGAINGLLSVAVKEYWNERKVKKIKKRVKAKAITASVKRSKAILTKGTSYCQHIACPLKGQNFLTKNMIKYDDAIFCSKECVEGYKNG